MEEVKFENAKRFVDYLRPSSGNWTKDLNYHSYSWRFRGQADASWGLLPSAFRQGVFDNYDVTSAKLHDFLNEMDNPSPTQLLYSKALNQILHEVRALEEFMELADSIGIKTPFGEHFIEVLESYVAKIAELRRQSDQSGKGAKSLPLLMPPKGHREAFGLAQHQGIATRLLDWTSSPLYAAYFAAKPIFDGVEQSEFMAVWAIDTAFLDLLQEKCHKQKHFPIVGFSTPYSTNAFIQAQKGFFTVDLAADQHFLKTGEWLPQNEVIKLMQDQRFKNKPKNPHPYPVLKKLILPSGEAKNLLRILYYEGVSPAHMMPSFENVKRTLEYRTKLFDELNDPFKNQSDD